MPANAPKAPIIEAVIVIVEYCLDIVLAINTGIVINETSSTIPITLMDKTIVTATITAIM